jgi:CxxC motif-containing protein
LDTKNLTCIGCPLGCNLEVLIDGNKVISVKGHTCKRGEEYGILECTNPTRVLTTTVNIEGGDVKVLSIKSEKAIPKNKMEECIRILKNIKLQAPIEIGYVVFPNILETGVNIIATKKVKLKL